MHTSATHWPTHSARTVLVEVCLYHNNRNDWANQYMEYVEYARRLAQIIIMAITIFFVFPISLTFYISLTKFNFRGQTL